MTSGNVLAPSDHPHRTYYLGKTTKLKYILIIKENDQNVLVQMCVFPV